MTKVIDKLEKFTIEEFQENFDNLLTRVENGESFTITSEYGNVVIIPYDEVVKILEDSGMDNDIIRIHTDHEDAS
jgi:aspartyl/asparaginyl-tRNA synthetase